MSNVDIHAPAHHFIGQVRGYGYRNWQTTTVKCNSAELAMSHAVLAMTTYHHRARVLIITESGYYEPNIVMEANR